MKQSIYIGVFFFTIFLSSSCEKFLDVKVDSQQILITNSEDCRRLLNNYTVFNTGYLSDGEASSGDFFMTDISYISSSLSAEDRDVYTWQPTAIRNVGAQWRNVYFKIYNANLVLEALEKLSDNPSQETKDGIRGGALFYRSFCFWQLAQLYCAPYSAASVQQPGIPLRMTSDINEVSNRGTVEQTYKKIVDDLTEASKLLPATSPVSSSPTQAAARAMLARVYLSMGNYVESLSNASAALLVKNTLIDYKTISNTSTTPFSRFNNEVLFQAVMTRSAILNSAVTASNVAKIDPTLYGSYASNDLRQQIFFKAVAGSAGTFAFTGNYEPTVDGTFFSGLAVDELYLIRAECYARSGNIELAMQDLNSLLRMRFSGTFTDIVASNADDALSKILSERRKELLMRGLRWTDLRRLNVESRFALMLRRSVQGTDYLLPPNDSRYTILIPNDVIQNSNLSQNSR